MQQLRHYLKPWREKAWSAFATAREFVMDFWQRWGYDGCPTGAAAISFFGILAFVPLLLGAMASLGFLIHDPANAAARVEGFVASVIPGQYATETARQLIQDAKIQERAEDLIEARGWALVFGVLSLLWTASRIFDNAIPPMNSAFNVRETRGFLQRQATVLGMFFGAGTLFLLSLVASALPALVSHLPAWKYLPEGAAVLLKLLGFSLGLLINGAMFAFLYRYLPSPEAGVTWRQAMVGGGVVALLWEIVKQALAFYLGRFGGGDNYNRVYGSLGGLIFLIFWVYITAMLLLFGAQIAQMYGERTGEAKSVHPGAPESVSRRYGEDTEEEANIEEEEEKDPTPPPGRREQEIKESQNQ